MVFFICKLERSLIIMIHAIDFIDRCTTGLIPTTNRTKSILNVWGDKHKRSLKAIERQLMTENGYKLVVVKVEDFNQLQGET